MITVYYDNTCPICQSEILHLTKKCPDKIIGIPIELAIDELTRFNISQMEAMTYLCLKDENGNVYKGIEAVRILHQTANTPFGIILALPIFKQVSVMIYPIFAKNRHKIPKWLAYKIFGKPEIDCDNGVCQLSPKQRLNAKK